MTAKYELVKDDTKEFAGRTLYRIRALVAIGLSVSAGDLGGYIEKEGNLSQLGDAWVCGDARVCGDAWVYGDARVYGDAWVCGNARVCGDAWVCGDARVCGDAWVYGDARVCGDALVYGDACLVWFSHVGSENGTLTVYRGKENALLCVRGCFSGTVDEFLAAVKKKHAGTRYEREYELLIEVAKSRILANNDERGE